MNFDGSGSSDPDGDPITYAWDLDGVRRLHAVTPTHTHQAGTFNARLRVTDAQSLSTTSAPVPISVNNTPPTATIDTPATGTTWKVGDVISFSGSATDPQQGTLPTSSLSWELILQHCPSNCHPHPLRTWPGDAPDLFFTAPDHEYPSYLELRLTATDAGGLTDTKTLRLDPRTVVLSFQSAPSGLQLTVGSSTGTTPFTREVIEGSSNTVSAPSPQTLTGTNYGWVSWSDGGAQSHNVVANAAATYTATYQALPPGPTGLAAAWSFDEGVGSTAGDASGNGNVGSVGSASWITTGRFGNALSFDGAGARVTVPDSGSLDLTSAMTLEAWVFPTVGGGWRDVIYKGPDDIYFLESSADSGAPATGGTFSSPIYGSSALPLNVWSHLAATYDGGDVAVVCWRCAGVESGGVGADCDLDGGVDDRR